MSINVMAADINSAEQQLINLVRNVYEIDGDLYQIDTKYIAKGQEYLARDDINLSQAQVNDYKSLFYANIGNAIDQGYMVKIGSLNESEKEQTSQKTETPNESTETVPENTSVNTPISENVTETTPENVTESATESETESATESETEAGTEKAIEAEQDASNTSDHAISDFVSVSDLDIDKRLENDEILEMMFGPNPNSTEREEIETSVQQPEQERKDYSNADPLVNNWNLGIIVVGITIIILIIVVAVVIWHRTNVHKKRKSRHRHHFRHK